MKHSRRRFLRAVTTGTGAVVVACRRSAPDQGGAPSLLGRPISRYGERSSFESTSRLLTQTDTPAVASSRTPLHELRGTITPASLHFERHHAGVPQIDPAEHRLLVHGLVDRPLVFTLEEVKRLPSVSRLYFLECSGNSAGNWRGAPQFSAQSAHGLTSCSEWTGVPLSLLLREVGAQPAGRWLIVEGADACKMSRSVPIEKAMDDALIAYAQNGEALRPEQGYPMRLFLPGWEGNTSVKWLHRIKVVDQPVMARDETSKYTDLLPDGRARQFTFMMEAKSIILHPSGSHVLEAPGFYEISGIAWSGRGAITRVEVSLDGGGTWAEARLQTPVLSKAHTRFTSPWRWDGRERVLASRCTDETGYVQPTRQQLVAARGLNSRYHYNGIQGWKVHADGTVVDAAL